MELAENVRHVFRESVDLAKAVVGTISVQASMASKKVGTPIKIMSFCGTHTWTVTYYGLRSMLPESVELVSGPGCPVCVTPSTVIREAVKLSLEGVRVYTFGDLYRVPAAAPGRLKTGPGSLSEARSEGGDVKVVYSFVDAIRDARTHGKDSVFVAVGFETTAPTFALPLRAGMVPPNLKLLSALKLTPPVMEYTVKLYRERGLLPIAGVIAPGHVSAVTGAKVWGFLPAKYGLPTVVAGFEPLDVLIAVAEILRMLIEGRPRVVIEYKRAVSWEGNKLATGAVSEVFEPVDAAWRGIGYIPKSGLALRERWRAYDAAAEYGIRQPSPGDYVLTSAADDPYARDMPPGCRCGEVILGIAEPRDCPMFMRLCTPSNPYGPCMVSSEGTCLIWAKYGTGFRG